jgi:hypothetical protein
VTYANKEEILVRQFSVELSGAAETHSGPKQQRPKQQRPEPLQNSATCDETATATATATATQNPAAVAPDPGPRTRETRCACALFTRKNA